jgi:hypothetical protein
MRRRGVILAAAWAALAALAGADVVVWSDGHAETGTVRLAGDGRWRLHDGAAVREYPLEAVAGLSWFAATQRLERAWRFVESGKTAKEHTGEPYPILDLRTEVRTREGACATGHLLTTAFYLERGATARKFVARAQVTGKPGQAPADVVYPAELVIQAGPSGIRAAAGWDVTVRAPAEAGWPAVAAVMCAPAATAARVTPLDGRHFRIEGEGGEPVVALRDRGRILVGWDGRADATLAGRVSQGVRDIRDFFDDRRALAVASNRTDAATVHSLVLVSRARPTTLDAAASLPWRLEVWRWRLGDDGTNLLLGARAVLFRDIRAAGAAQPEVRLSPGLARAARNRSDELTWDWDSAAPTRRLAEPAAP